MNIFKWLTRNFTWDTGVAIAKSTTASVKVPPYTPTVIDRSDRRPICIYHEGDGAAYYAESEEIQDAWNDYAQGEADAFDNHPSRDSYDSTSVFPGWNRDGDYTSWCPQKFFPEWLEEYKEKLK